ncbi:MAG: hypothetical protein ABIO70_18965 [Pseudomonadota bacterium]
MSTPLPPTPTEAARDSLTEGAKDMAKGALMRRVLRFARQKLPRPLYNVIFSGKSAGQLAEEEARRRVGKLLWGCGFSLVFGCLVFLVLLGVLVIVGWALLLA